MSASPAPLSYQQLQMVRAFVYLAKRAGLGATRREIERELGKAHKSAAVRAVLHRLIQWQIVFARVRVDLPHRPNFYYAHESAWQT